MRTVIQVFVFFFFAMSISKAQPTTGTIFVGSDLELYVTSHKTKSDNTTTLNSRTTNFTLLPRAGYFLNDVMAIGAGLGYSGYVINYDDNAYVDKESSSTLVLNPFARYYIINQKGGLFVEANMSFSLGNTKTENNGETSKDNLTNIFLGIKPGVYYYITSRVALQAYYGWFGFQSNRIKTDGDIKNITNDFGLNLNSNTFAFGFVYEF